VVLTKLSDEQLVKLKVVDDPNLIKDEKPPHPNKTEDKHSDNEREVEEEEEIEIDISIAQASNGSQLIDWNGKNSVSQEVVQNVKRSESLV